MALLLLALAPATSQAATNVRASVDRTSLALTETLTLTLSADSISFSGEPDVSALEQDFHVLNQQESSRSSFINGKVTSSRQWDFTLAPKHKGILTIPAIPMGQYQTRPISVEVSEAPQQPKTGSEQIYMEADVTPRRVFVQAQLDFTVKIFTSVTFLEASLDPLEVEGAIVEAAGEERYQTTINGRYYQVIERRYTLYPQRSGELEIPALTLQARVESYRQSMLDPGRLVVKRSSPIRVQVMPPAEKFDGAVWLPAKAIALSDSWSQDPGEIQVGDSITRTITLQADGLLGSQLPALPQTELANAKLYPDQPSIRNLEDGPWTGERVESVAIIPTQPGRYHLPEIRIAWWNTDTNQQEYAVLPARELVVKPAPGAQQDGAQSAPVMADDAEPDRAPALASVPQPSWLWLVVALLVLSNLLFMVLWWRARRRTAASPPATAHRPEPGSSEKNEYQKLRKMCKGSASPLDLRRQLLRWAEAAWEQPMTLSQLAERCPELGPFCHELDAALYSTDAAELNVEGVKETLERCRKRVKQAETEEQSDLKPLYPRWERYPR